MAVLHVLFVFSGPEHQKTDWLGIHEKICQLLIPLRTPIPFLGSEEERQHRKQQQIVRQVFIIFCYCFEQKGIEKHLRIQSTKLLKYLNPLSPKIKLVFPLTELEDTP